MSVSTKIDEALSNLGYGGGASDTITQIHERLENLEEVRHFHNNLNLLNEYTGYINDLTLEDGYELVIDGGNAPTE